MLDTTPTTTGGMLFAGVVVREVTRGINAGVMGFASYGNLCGVTLSEDCTDDRWGPVWEQGFHWALKYNNGLSLPSYASPECSTRRSRVLDCLDLHPLFFTLSSSYHRITSGLPVSLFRLWDCKEKKVEKQRGHWKKYFPIFLRLRGGENEGGARQSELREGVIRRF